MSNVKITYNYTNNSLEVYVTMTDSLHHNYSGHYQLSEVYLVRMIFRNVQVISHHYTDIYFILFTFNISSSGLGLNRVANRDHCL
jgi:hypothetical protein